MNEKLKCILCEKDARVSKVPGKSEIYYFGSQEIGNQNCQMTDGKRPKNLRRR